MSQTYAPYGLSFVEYKGGKNKGTINTYAISSGYAYSFAQGDPVQIGNGGVIAAYTGAAIPASGTATAATISTLGIFVNVTYVNTQGQTVISPYWPANTETYGGYNAIVTLADVPYNIYKVQCSGTLPGVAGNDTAVGQNFNLTDITTAANTPNAVTGQSRVALNVSSGNVGNWPTVKVVGLANPAVGGSNSWLDPYPDVLVIINNHVYKPGTYGITA